jgi:hypothetical protein
MRRLRSSIRGFLRDFLMRRAVPVSLSLVAIFVVGAWLGSGSGREAPGLRELLATATRALDVAGPTDAAAARSSTTSLHGQLRQAATTTSSTSSTMLRATSTTMLVSTTVSSSTTSTVEGPQGVCGDPSGDQMITATDALIALRTAVGLQSCILCLCDVDSSGFTSATDALIILKQATGQSVQFACIPC